MSRDGHAIKRWYHADALSQRFYFFARAWNVFEESGAEVRDDDALCKTRSNPNRWQKSRGLGCKDESVFWNVGSFDCGVIGMEMRDKDPSWPVLQVLLLTAIEEQAAVYKNSRVLNVTSRGNINISTRSENS